MSVKGSAVTNKSGDIIQQFETTEQAKAAIQDWLVR
jgi:hypothetical protein